VSHDEQARINASAGSRAAAATAVAQEQPAGCSPTTRDTDCEGSDMKVGSCCKNTVSY
jgi:hypothetical protein